MKRLFGSIVLMCLMTVEAMAYDFSAECSTGQTLYYNIIGDGSSVAVTYEKIDYERESSHYTNPPTGDLTIPSKVSNGGKTYSVTEISTDVFELCYLLTSITIPSTVTEIQDYAFIGCGSLVSFRVDSNNEYYKSVDGVLYFCPKNDPSENELVCYPPSKGKSFTIPENVTSIGTTAFSYCMNLQSVTIPGSVSSIGDFAFAGCNDLTYMLCHAYNPPTASDRTFQNANNITVHLCGANESAYRSAAGWGNLGLKFAAIPSLTLNSNNEVICEEGSLELPFSIDYHSAGNESSTWQYAVDGGVYKTFAPNSTPFDQLDGKTLTIKCSASNVCGLSVDSVTSKLAKGKKITIDSTVCDSLIWNGIHYKTSGSYVQRFPLKTGCDSIVTMKLTVNQSQRITTDTTVCDGIQWHGIRRTRTATYWFRGETSTGCPLLETLKLKVNNSKIITIDTTVTSRLKWGDSTFTTSGTHVYRGTTSTGCDSVVTLKLTVTPKFSAVCSTGQTLYYNVTSDSTVEVTSQNATYPFYSTFPTGDTLEVPTRVTIGGMTYKVTRIGDYAFGWCSEQKCIKMPRSITSIGDNAFNICTGLTSLTLPDSITSIGQYAFSSCKGLSNITIPNSVENIESEAFEYCSGLTSIEIPSGVKRFGLCVFWGCPNLSEIKVSSQNTRYESVDGVLYNIKGDTLLAFPQGKKGTFTIPSTVKVIRAYAFFLCENLTTIEVPSSVKVIERSGFADCHALKSIKLPSGIQRIESYVFCGCRALTNIEMPSSIKSIGDSTFSFCSALASVTIPDSVESIGNGAFINCTSLTSLTLPSGLKNIKKAAFYYCKNLSSIVCRALIPPTVGSNAFYHVNDSIPVYLCGSTSVDVYKAADGWKNFKNMIAAGTPTVKLANSNSSTCDNANLELPAASINYITKVNTDSTWMYAVNGGAYDTLKTAAFSLGQFGGKTLTIKCAASNVCGMVADSVMLKVNKSVRVAMDSMVCDSVLWNGKSCYQSGVYTFNGVTATGCDSIVTMNLKVNKSVRVAIDSTVNKGIVWNKMACDTTGDYVYNGVTATGCDSIVTLHLTVKPATPSAVSVLTSEEGAAFVVTAMPNPARANENFVVMVKGLGCDELSGASLMVYAENGRLVYGAKGVSAANAVSLPCGNYVAVVTTAGGRRTQCKVLVRP